MKRMTCLGLGMFLLLAVLAGVGQANGFPGEGEGTQEEPYEIVSLEGLHWIRTDTDARYAHYKLMRDLNFNDDDSYDDPSNKSFWTTGEGWEPILIFSGTLDGGGRTITGLYINRSTDLVGLFGSMDGGTVENLGLVGVNITGADYTGGFAGYCMGGESIVNSYGTGSVHGHRFVGGLFGINGGSITESYFKGGVQGDYAVGGIVGQGWSGSTITNSYAAGNVSGNTLIGGVLGWNMLAATVANSYSTANVSGSGAVGGLVGGNEGQITNSYSTGSVGGTGERGGLVGITSQHATVQNSLYDSETSGMSDTGKGEPKTSAEMKTKSTFTNAGWNIQTSATDLNKGYPYLSWQSGNSPIWYIYEADEPDPEPDPEPEPEPSPRPRPSPEPEPEPEPEYPLPPPGFNASPSVGFLLSVKLEWLPSESEGVVAYNVYVSTGPEASRADAGTAEAEGLKFWQLDQVSSETFDYTHTGLTRNLKYYYVVTSVNEEGLESNESSKILWYVAGTDEYGELDAISWGPERIIDEPEADDSSTCFIATAAYGSAMSSEVMSLRKFRDGFLLSSVAGSRLVEAYYAASPVFAGVVAESGILRKVARMHLAPFAGFAKIISNMN